MARPDQIQPLHRWKLRRTETGLSLYDADANLVAHSQLDLNPDWFSLRRLNGGCWSSMVPGSVSAYRQGVPLPTRKPDQRQPDLRHPISGNRSSPNLVKPAWSPEAGVGVRWNGKTRHRRTGAKPNALTWGALPGGWGHARENRAIS